MDGIFGREGWLPNIESERLDLADGNRCMIGQMFPQTASTLYNNFQRVVNSGMLTKKMATQRGFFLPKEAWMSWTPTVDDYALLTDMWIEHMAYLKKPKEPEAVPSPIQQKDINVQDPEAVRIPINKKKQ